MLTLDRPYSSVSTMPTSAYPSFRYSARATEFHSSVSIRQALQPVFRAYSS